MQEISTLTPSLEEIQWQKFAMSEQAITELEEFHAAFKKRTTSSSLSCLPNKKFAQAMLTARESLGTINKEEPKIFKKIKVLAQKIETAKDSPKSEEFKHLLQQREAAAEYIKNYPTYLLDKSRELAGIFNKLKSPVSLSEQELQQFDDLMEKARSIITEYGGSAVELWHNQIKFVETLSDAIPEQQLWTKTPSDIKPRYPLSPQKNVKERPITSTPAAIQAKPATNSSLSSKICFFGAAVTIGVGVGAAVTAYTLSRKF
jgi:hypothetical protein